MKILMTSHRFAPDVGGIEMISEVLAINFIRLGHQVALVTQTPHSSDRRLDSLPYIVERQPSFPKLLALYRWADVVLQVNIELRTLWPILFVRKPFVISTCTWVADTTGKTRIVDRLKRWVLGRATASIANSQSVRRSTCAESVVIAHPYHSDIFRRLANVEKSYALAFVGRMVSDKGVDLLLKAFAILLSDSTLRTYAQSSGWDLVLTLIGNGPELPSLTRLAQDLDIDNNVRFVGSLQGEDLVQCLNQHHVLAVPSRWAEPFGIVALEGAACGCIVVGSDGGGLPDAIGDGGFLFPSGSVEDCASTLRVALTLSPEDRASLRTRATVHLQRHTEQYIAALYLSLMEDAVAVYPGKVSSLR